MPAPLLGQRRWQQQVVRGREEGNPTSTTFQVALCQNKMTVKPWLESLARSRSGGGASLALVKKAWTQKCCVPKGGEKKWTLFFFQWLLVQQKVKRQIAQEAEVFCSSAFGLNMIQSGSNQKIMYSDSSTMSYEKWAGTLWFYQAALCGENLAT